MRRHPLSFVEALPLAIRAQAGGCRARSPGAGGRAPPQKRFDGAPESARAACDYVRDIVGSGTHGLTPDRVDNIRLIVWAEFA
ncbi:hypothetical protein [Streptomyces sp. NPDC059247]|uniref:hypothetical protein n=1 Tax=Streptomyces sp. NPDC059247 TaxID=3346790 RepID=UPI0036B4962A